MTALALNEILWRDNSHVDVHPQGVMRGDIIGEQKPTGEEYGCYDRMSPSTTRQTKAHCEEKREDH